MPDELPAPLLEVLAESARLGFLGPGPVEPAAAHAAAFCAVLRPAARVLDLGSGGGLPGLVLAHLLEAEIILLDASVTRTDFLRRAVGRLGLTTRVRVVTGRAELVARADDWRSSCDAVVARSFGPPAVTAECAAPFLRPGGQLVVAEPPASVEGRWPPAGIALLGLTPDRAVDPSFASFTLSAPCPARYPRRSLRPPLF